MSPITRMLLFALFVLLASCSERKEAVRNPAEETSRPKKGQYLVNNLGDTISTGVPIPAVGKQIDPGGVAQPKPIQLREKPHIILTNTNVRPAGNPKVISVEQELQKITPGENGIRLPDTLPAIKTTAPAHPSKPIAAAPLEMRDNAIANIQYLAVEEGLSDYYIWSLLEDRRGNLWIGDRYGTLNRYDGQSLTFFSSPEGLPAHAHSLRSLLEDEQGNIWFGTMTGIGRYDGNHFIYYSHERGASYRQVNALAQDRQGKIWFGTREQGAGCFDPNNEQGAFIYYTTKEGMSHNTINAILADRDGNLWFGTEGGGLSYFDGHAFIHYTVREGLSSNKVQSLLEDQQGHIWIGTTGGGLSRFDGHTFLHYSKQEGLSGHSVKALMEDKQGRIWFNSNQKTINYFDGKTFTTYDEENGTKSSYGNTFLEDSQGNIWIGTNEGLHKFGITEFRHFNNELLSLDVSAINEDHRGNVWFGVYGDLYGAIRFDGQVFTAYTRNPRTNKGLDFMQHGISALLEDTRSKLWIGTNGGGAICFDPDPGLGTFTRFDIGKGPGNNIFSIQEDGLGRLWFGTLDGLIYSDREAFIKYSPAKESGSGETLIHSLTKDKDNNIWFGNNNYLGCFDSDSFTYYTKREGLPNNFVHTLLKDSKEHLWIGTNEGLSHFDGQHFSNFTTEDGLIDNRIFTLTEDERQNIWVGTQNGLSVLVPSNPGGFADTTKAGLAYKILNFGKEDGLKQADFVLRSAYLDSKNRIWWGKTKGAMMLDLNTFELPSQPAKVYLSHIEVNQQFVDFRRLSNTAYAQALPFGETLSHTFDSVAPFFNYPLKMALPYSLNHLAFHFSGIDWAGPHKLRYSYWLEGLDDGWSLPQAEPKAEYRNLPHGTFTLKVKAIGAAQTWSEAFEYNFTIHPPWWYTWWAYTLYIIAFLALLTGLFLYQRRRYQLQARLQLEQERAERLQELDSFKSRFYTNITHEFRTPLTVIKGMTDQIGGHEKIKNLIQRNTNRLLNMVNQLLDLSRLENNSLAVNWVQGDVIPYLQYLTESCHSLANNKQVNLAFFSKEDSLVMDYDETKLQHILINLLSNAIKFTPEYGSVKVTAAQVLDNGEPFLELAVSDTGKGIAKEHLPHIFDRFYQAPPVPPKGGELPTKDHPGKASSATSPLRGDRGGLDLGGAGIGLALVKELVQLLEGQIKVDSEENKGTTFLVMLPIRNEAVALHLQGEEQAARKGEQMTHSIKSTSALHPVPPGPQKGESARPNQPINPSTKPLILIIEDNADVTEYIISCLKDGYSLQTARNGKEGVEKARESVPDVILCDVMMPEMDGFEACRILKSERSTSHIPIVLLTAKATQEDKVAGLSQGADVYLTKPFDKEELLVRLKNLAGISQRLRERLADATTGEEQASEQEQREAAFLQELHEIVETNMGDESFGTSRLCRAAAMSRTQLHRKLKALTGQATASFIRSIRLRKAKALLETTDLPIGDIAVQVGYKDFSHFSRSFGKEFGVLPSEVRRGGGGG